MRIIAINENNQNNDEFGLAKKVVIKKFRKVSIFGEKYTKIVYMHSPTDFSIERIGDDVDPDENVQVISGPRAEELITEMINHEKQKGSTFVWSGARFENLADETCLKYRCKSNCWDPLIRDCVESEEDRHKLL